MRAPRQGLRAIGRLVSRLRHPQTTVRWRLTLLYGGMFLVCGAALLGVTYALVSHQITGSAGMDRISQMALLTNSPDHQQFSF